MTNGPTSDSRTDAEKVMKGAGFYLIGGLLGNGFQIAVQIILARTLGTELFGLYALGWTLLRIMGTITPLGMENGVLRFATPHWPSDSSGLKDILFQALGTTLGFSMVVSGVFILAAPWLAIDVFQDYRLEGVIRGFAVAFPLFAGMKVASAATRVSQEAKFSVYTEQLLQPAVQMILVILFCILGWGLNGAVAAVVLSFGFGITLAWHYVRTLYAYAFAAPWSGRLINRKLLAFSLPTTLVSTLLLLNIRADRFFIGYFRSVEEVGIYQAVSQVSIVFMIIFIAFNAIFTPMIADLYERGEIARLGQIFSITTKWGLNVGLLVYIVILSVASELVPVIFGVSYGGNAILLIILSTAELINVVAGGAGIVLVMTGHPNRWLRISVFALLINIVLNILLIPTLGIIGAAISTMCGVITLVSLGLLDVRRTLGLWPYDRRHLKGLVAALITITVLWLIQSMISVSPIIRILISCLVGLSMYGTNLLLLGLDPEDRDFLLMARSRFTSYKQR